MSMTVPQIIILNHAAYVNSQRSDERAKRKRDKEDKAAEEQRQLDEDDPVVYMGKRLSQLNSDEMMRYYNQDIGVML
jgi:hypothetical protein